jgi:hypothetical protein
MELCGISGIEVATDIKGVPTHGRTRSRVLRVLIWSSVLLLLAGAFYLFFGRKEEVKVRPAAQITITNATAQKREYRGLSGGHRDSDSGLHRFHL